MIKNGPLCPAAIFYEFGVWRAEINGDIQPSPDPDPIKAGKVLWIWHGSRQEITLNDYRARLKRAADPSHPSSRPREAIDLAAKPPLF